jgi:phospholipid/cholesterol/gamma-HCH transport system permease protein
MALRPTKASRTLGAVGGGIRELGALAEFGARATLGLGGTLRYAAEVLRQCALLLLGSTIVIVGMQLVVGAECSLFASYFTRAFGASGTVGVFSELCTVREMFPYMFGYILAAKVGCGLVAEIGSMRIADELDALEVMGIDPISFIVGTRLLAAYLALPIIYTISLLTGSIGAYLVVVHQVGEVSRGAFDGGFFGPIHSLGEDFRSLIKAMVLGTSIVIVGIYYGYNARGGPTGVGAATARSMVVNLVLIHVLGATMSIGFWGLGGDLPFGG